MAIAEILTPTDRLGRLRDDVMARGCSRVETVSPALPDVALWRAARPGLSRVQQRAAFLLELVRLAPLEIRPAWTIAGEHLTGGDQHVGAFVLAGETSEAQLAEFEPFGLTKDDVADCRRAVRAWLGLDDAGRGRAAYYAVGATALEMGPGDQAWRVYAGNGWSENHSIRDFGKVLRLGFAGILAEADEHLAAADPSDAEYPQRENFRLAVRSVCQAGMLLGRRYAELAERLVAEARDPAERRRLEGIAERCARVPAEGARTLAEAVQSLWLTFVLSCGEDGVNANSIGRLDQLLQPFYEADLAAGRTTHDEAVELMAELACKLYRHYDVQAITLGGVDRDGRDATNAISHVILEATLRVDFVRDVALRMHPGLPDSLLDLAVERIAQGGGIPFLFNDEAFIPALAARGIPLEEAREYAYIGCIELTIPGKTSPHAVSGIFNAAKCFELALFDGVDPRTGEQLGPHTGAFESFTSIDDVQAAYRRQIDWFARRMVYHCNRGELMQRERGPLPCLSTLTDDCLARGRDISDGGARYQYHSICFMGAANVADSLAAIDQLVFRERRLTASELTAALRADFEGHEAVRRLLLTQAPKYGNDLDEVDRYARQVSEEFIALMDEMRSPLGGRYVVHLFTFLWNVSAGKQTGALPDGRRGGDPLAYSLSAHQGRDTSGVTALLASVAKLPHDQAAGATAAIIDLDPAVVEGEAGRRRLKQLIRSAMALGVGQLQWNVTTVERLRQAQADPEHYGNLAVRVAGYSQMFRLLDRDLQEMVIARTKHTR